MIEKLNLNDCWNFGSGHVIDDSIIDINLLKKNNAINSVIVTKINEMIDTINCISSNPFIVNRELTEQERKEFEKNHENGKVIPYNSNEKQIYESKSSGLSAINSTELQKNEGVKFVFNSIESHRYKHLLDILEAANKIIIKLMHENQEMIDRQNKHEECLAHGTCRNCLFMMQAKYTDKKKNPACELHHNKGMDNFFYVNDDFYCKYFKKKNNT
jgi:hypothetical protein